MVKSVLKALMIRRIGKSKAGKIGGYDMKIVRELRDQVAEHVA